MDLLLEIAGGEMATLLTVTHDHGLLKRFERIIDLEPYAEGP
jgi:ABC-type lipoprotein export system ATPase subunit